MSETVANRKKSRLQIRYRGRSAQVWIYLGKMLRMFIYQNDWKVLPMAALIAGLVGMVIRTRLFVTMEGTLMGAFALVMVCIWNGCFNSIQVICRERDVIKREHRSGMHISSYIRAHMIYQELLCRLQTAVTIYITLMVGVKYEGPGLVTPFLIVDFGISMFLIAYASDMLALWISSLSKSTTTAMTIMPFVLIFQLVFSGGMMSLPAWTNSITPLTISNPALKVLATQSNYNSRPVMTVWNTLNGMKDREVSATVTLGQAMDLLQKEDNPFISDFRAMELSGSITVGNLLDGVAESPEVQAHREDSHTFTSTVGGIVDMIGADRVKDLLQNRIAEASQIPDYEYTTENVVEYWLRLILFVIVFAALSIITLEFIDRDRR